MGAAPEADSRQHAWRWTGAGGQPHQGRCEKGPGHPARLTVKRGRRALSRDTQLFRAGGLPQRQEEAFVSGAAWKKEVQFTVLPMQRQNLSPKSWQRRATSYSVPPIPYTPPGTVTLSLTPG